MELRDNTGYEPDRLLWLTQKRKVNNTDSRYRKIPAINNDPER